MELDKLSDAQLTKRWRDLRAKRLKLERQATDIKSSEAECEAEARQRCLQRHSQGFKAAAGTITLQELEITSVEDWPAFYKWVRRNNRFDLMQRRINNSAAWDAKRAGKKVAGLEFSKIKKARLTSKG